MLIPEPLRWFRNRYYFRLNARRFEHLAQLGLPLEGRRVLEVGAGVGDHTPFLLARGCRVTATEGRPENLAVLGERFASDRRVEARALDLDAPAGLDDGPWEVCYCYGVLYHLVRPAEALAFLAERTSGFLLLETVCRQGDEPALNPVEESQTRASQSLRGTGCRPTRAWVMAELGRHFPHVYTTVRQPWHPEFQNDWTLAGEGLTLGRAVFVASREEMSNAALTAELPGVQERC